jgi:hypothetical protein
MMGVFENSMLRYIWYEVTADWRRLHNEQLYNSTNIIRVVKSRILRWTEHVARMRRGEMYMGLWWGRLRVTEHLEKLSVDGRKMLKKIFKKYS